jgi:hypothetical protein
MKMLLFLPQLHHTKETDKTSFVQLENTQNVGQKNYLTNRNAYQWPLCKGFL